MDVISVQDHIFHPGFINADSLVLDIGCHKGAFAQEILKRFNCQVEGFEPDRDLQEIIKTLDHPKFTWFPWAVNGSGGQGTFYVYDLKESNSILKRTKKDCYMNSLEASYEVKFASLEECLHGRRCDLVKMDSEGAEIDTLLNTPGHVLQLCKQISVEFHSFCQFDPPVTREQVDQCVDRLTSLGFQSEELHSFRPDYFFFR